MATIAALRLPRHDRRNPKGFSTMSHDPLRQRARKARDDLAFAVRKAKQDLHDARIRLETTEALMFNLDLDAIVDAIPEEPKDEGR